MPYEEKDFQADFSRWLVAHPTYAGGAFELKIALGDSLPFAAVKEHQVASLDRAKHIGFVHKIPDIGTQNPFDCIFVFGKAWVVIKYHARRPGMRDIVIIDIDVWEREKTISVRKSLTEARAREIGRVFTVLSRS